MSGEKIETIRGLAKAIGRRDFDRAIQSFDENAELRPAVEGIDVAALYRGRVELMAFWALIVDGWDAVAVELTDAVDAPGERVMAVELWRFRGRGGLVLESELVDVYTFRDGLIVRIDGYRDRAEALAAVGLSE
jgi:ketosteroid isomerase-like protein